MDGYYKIVCHSDIGLVTYLYENIFDPATPEENILLLSESISDSMKCRFNIFLAQMKNYTFVTTTSNSYEIGPFSLVSTGPSTVTFMKLNFSGMYQNKLAKHLVFMSYMKFMGL